jgi:hypothetical protein
MKLLAMVPIEVSDEQPGWCGDNCPGILGSPVGRDYCHIFRDSIDGGPTLLRTDKREEPLRLPECIAASGQEPVLGDGGRVLGMTEGFRR